MALVPRDLLQQIADLEKLFNVPPDTLNTITDHFVSELEKGGSSHSHTDCRINYPWGVYSVLCRSEC
jgi:hexokinase